MLRTRKIQSVKGVGAENLTDLSQPKSVFSAIYWLLKPFERKIVVLNLVYVTLTCIDLFSLAFLGYYLSVLLGGQPVGSLHQLALRCFGSEIDLLSLILILVFLVRGCFGTLATYFTNRVVTLIESQVKLELLQGYQSLPYTEWAKKNSSDYINTLNVVVPKVFTVLVLPLFKMLSDSILAGAIFIFFFFLNLKAFLLFTALIIAFAGLYDLAIKKRLGTLSRKFKTLSVGLLSETRNTMDGAKEIRVFSIENFFSDRFSQLAVEYGRSQSLLNTFSQAPRYFLELIIVSFVGILVFLAHRSG
ncbi:ABC transporter ATP-binding protein, partial [bacterium]|nr:ABC transporter ATP-binding protein [bacterium]